MASAKRALAVGIVPELADPDLRDGAVQLLDVVLAGGLVRSKETVTERQ